MGFTGLAWGLTLLFSIPALTLYFLPTILAFAFGKHNTSTIFLINFFLGWTLIGWVVALVRSFKD